MPDPDFSESSDFRFYLTGMLGVASLLAFAVARTGTGEWAGLVTIVAGAFVLGSVVALAKIAFLER